MSASALPAPAMRPPALTAALLLALLLAALGLAFRDTFAAMISVWNTESFAHGWIIAPISAWLIWTQRARLRQLPVKPFLPALAGLAVCGAAWLVGHLAGVNTVEQFAVVGMIPWLVALVFGWTISWAIAFPLLFLFFAVPFGQFLQQPMMEFTADFTVAAIRLSGVPIVREGLHFELPTGRWSVVEACSGLRYLLAALPLACIYAYQSYRAWRVRLLFVVTVVLVAIVANWVRAYLIVMIGHHSGMTLAVGVDHLIYGWVFFGIVMGLSFWAGSFWQDAPDSDSVRQASGPSAGLRPSAPVAALLLSALLGLAASAGWPLLARGLQAADDTPEVSLAVLSERVETLPVPTDPQIYRPMYEGGIGQVHGHLRSDPSVGIRVVHYLGQNRSGEMITWGNRVVPAGPEDLTWQIRRRTPLAPTSAGSGFPEGQVNEYEVTGPSGRYLVWEWFQVNGRLLTDPRRVKLQTAFDLIRGRGDESLAWFLWTPVDDSADAARARVARAAEGLGQVSLRMGAR